jgi:serine/threonine-protein kinase
MSTQTDRLNAALAGRYRIERHLGEGGMASVYLCSDLKHDRKVALKLLKPELAAVLGADRFIAEIKTTAALQHPHILPLFDSGTADGLLYYVMPYIAGETLRAKLDRETQLSIDEALRIATQVADALDYAHRHGVIHRDIKPENILLHDGRPMVADFGIALAVSAAAGGRMTETGLSLGTPHYMSPEQATAEKEITGRSDIYSLASVLYEMLTGEPPHMGNSAQQIIMKIIIETPRSVTTLRRSVPHHVAAAVAKALEKLPADRFDSAAKFAEALNNPAFTTASAAGPIVAPAAEWRHRAAIPALGLAVALALMAAWALRRPPPPLVISRYEINLPEGKRIGSTQWSPLAVSPDGSKLVYVGENGRLFVRSRDQLDVVELAGTDGAFNPFFSHDGQRVGFMSGQAGNAELKIASLMGGPPMLVTAKGVGGPGASWGYDGFIYFDASGVGPLRRISENGGVSETVSTLDSASGELQHNWPDALPNGRGVLIAVDRSGPGVNVASDNDIAVLDLKTRKHRTLVRGVIARYAASGHILYVTSTGVLMAVPFDQDRLELTGSPVALTEGISIRRGGGGVDLAISRTGTLWYGVGTSFGQREVVWATRSGEFSEADPGWVGDFGSLALSPDGTRLAVSIDDPAGEHIWVKQLGRSGGALSKVTFNRSNTVPRWHPDGTRLLFASSFVATVDLRVVRPDGSAQPTVLLDDHVPVQSATWSPDGRWVIYERRRGTARDIYGMHVGMDTARVPLVSTDFMERNASVSPDGRWLLYEADPTGRFEVYVRPFPNTSESLAQVSTAGGTRPKWSHNGQEIFFANGNEDLVSVAVRPGKSFTTGEQRVLLSLRGVTDWDVAPDDRRFIIIRDRQGQQRRKLVVVENVFEELKAKAPR